MKKKGKNYLPIQQGIRACFVPIPYLSFLISTAAVATTSEHTLKPLESMVESTDLMQQFNPPDQINSYQPNDQDDRSLDQIPELTTPTAY